MDSRKIEVTIYYSSTDKDQIVLENVPFDVTCEQLLQKIASIFEEKEKVEKEKFKNIKNQKEPIDISDYSIKMDDKLLEEYDIIESDIIEVIRKPKECTPISDILVFSCVLLYFLFPVRNADIFPWTLFCLALFATTVGITSSKKDYTHILPFFWHRMSNNSFLDSFVLLIKSFSPTFRLEQVLLNE